MAINTPERLRSSQCLVHEAGCSSSPHLELKAWRIPGKLVSSLREEAQEGSWVLVSEGWCRVGALSKGKASRPNTSQLFPQTSSTARSPRPLWESSLFLQEVLLHCPESLG